jgi:hypothetical protein
MEKGIDYYYGAIIGQIKPEIDQVSNNAEIDPVEKAIAIAHLKMEAFKTAATVAGMVVSFISAIQEEQ